MAEAANGASEQPESPSRKRARSPPALAASPAAPPSPCFYVYHPAVPRLSRGLPVHKERSALVHSLIAADGLLGRAEATRCGAGEPEPASEDDARDRFRGPLALTVVRPRAATGAQLREYHASEYVEALLGDGAARPEGGGGAPLGGEEEEEEEEEDPEEEAAEEEDPEEEEEEHFPAGDAATRFGLCDDCPPFRGLGRYAALVAGGTLAAADALMDSAAAAAAAAASTSTSSSSPPPVAFHWDGGRHHARRASASGYCYVNDCVLGVSRLLARGCRRVLYCDVDVHHCDAVEGAFLATDRVLVVSIHKKAPGFFPGTGAAADLGIGRVAGGATPGSRGL